MGTPGEPNRSPLQPPSTLAPLDADADDLDALDVCDVYIVMLVMLVMLGVVDDAEMVAQTACATAATERRRIPLLSRGRGSRETNNPGGRG